MTITYKLSYFDTNVKPINICWIFLIIYICCSEFQLYVIFLIILLIGSLYYHPRFITPEWLNKIIVMASCVGGDPVANIGGEQYLDQQLNSYLKQFSGRSSSNSNGEALMRSPKKVSFKVVLEVIEETPKGFTTTHPTMPSILEESGQE